MNEPNHIDAARASMVDRLVAVGMVTDPTIATAFRTVPQHQFLPSGKLGQAYQDAPVKLTHTSSSSPPSVMATMLGRLRLRPGHRVLELGSGTGYNAAMLRNIVGPTGRVVTVEVDPKVAAFARADLERTGHGDVEVRLADAMSLHLSEPFDRVVFTYAVANLPPLVWELAPGTRVVAPVVLRANIQKLVAWRRTDAGLTGEFTGDCYFLPQMSGDGRVRGVTTLGPRADAGVIGPADPDRIALTRALFGPDRVDRRLRHDVTTRDVMGGLDAWIATHDARACTLGGFGEASHHDLVPWTSGQRPGLLLSATFGLSDGARLAVVAPPAGHRPTSFGSADQRPYRLHIRHWPGAEHLADALSALVDAWAAAGRPRSRQLCIDATPGADLAALTDPTLIAVAAETLRCTWSLPER